MEKLSVPLGERNYSIYIDGGLMGRIPRLLDEMGLTGLTVLVTDDRVKGIFGNDLAQGLREAGLDTRVLEIPQGERSKTLQWAETLYDGLVSLRADRTTLMVALGGGVVGDLTGFVAATYMRGIPYIQVPTTLLAQVDSSVGGKTAVNHPKGKNLIGAFYQPRAVFIDTHVLRSLPDLEFLSGLAEVVKYGVISDRSFFNHIRDNLGAIRSLDEDALIGIIGRACAIKAEVVIEDERESGLRAILNFGHTIGHAVESLTGYEELRHGECVSIGMACAARISGSMGLCSRQDAEELIALLDSVGLPTRPTGLNPKDVLTALVHDKKAVQGRLRFVLMEGLGKVVTREGVNEEIILKSLTH